MRDVESAVEGDRPLASEPEWLRALEAKQARARALLRSLGRVVVAFSGGVDSSLLLRLATEELGAEAIAALAVGPSLAERERQSAIAVAEQIGCKLELIETKEFENPRYLQNDAERCFWWRSALVEALRPLARERDAVLVYGAITDDLGDDRPGMRAAERGGMRAPLLEAGLGKDEVRELARRSGLPVWDKPALACLSSRVPRGDPIRPERLARIERAEDAVLALGFRVVRVRDHGDGDLARLELGTEELPRAVAAPLRGRLEAAVRAAGYRFVCIDLRGYRAAGSRESAAPERPGGPGGQG
ncbi:MAG: ATP-dependent sacrificial sulfur transferase LarE [Acidobacteriota bacterium]|nr:MAG: ATP-dependent sacrificial sulfur transferase LarE [Acidobacteriota bacterium]